MAAAGRIVAEILESLKTVVSAGMSTADVEAYVDAEIKRRKAIPAFKGYRGYPSSICISLNAEVVHGIPSKSVKIRKGDLVSIDLGVILGGYYGDAAITIPVEGYPLRPGASLMLLNRHYMPASIRRLLATVCRIYPQRSRSMSRPTDSVLCAHLSATASAGRCMKSRRYRIMANRDKAPAA